MGKQRTPDEIWSALEKEALEGDDAERAASRSIEDVVKELAAAGVDVERERAEARAIRAELERNVAVRQKAKEAAALARVRSLRPKRRRTAIVWLAAAAALVVCATVAYAGWRHWHAPPPMPAPPAPPVRPAPTTAPSAPPSSELIAADFRRRAFDACDAKRWSDCLSLFDRAREVDAAGDADRQVQAARQTAAAHLEGTAPGNPDGKSHWRPSPDGK